MERLVNGLSAAVLLLAILATVGMAPPSSVAERPSTPTAAKSCSVPLLQKATRPKDDGFITVCYSDGTCERVPRPKKLSIETSTTAEWVARIRDEPVEELMAAREKAVPILIAATQDEEACTWLSHMLSAEKEDTAWLIPVYAAALQSPDVFMRSRAIEELGKFGPAVEPSMPAIVEGLKSLAQQSDSLSWFRRRPLVELLEKINVPATDRVAILKLMLAALPDDFSTRTEREELMECLLRAEANPTAVMLEIINGLKSPHDFPHAWRSLEPPLLTEVLATLSADDASQRRAAAFLLSKQNDGHGHGTLDAEVLTQLLPHLDDEDAHVREYLLDTLGQHPVLDAESVPFLVRRLADEHHHNLYHAARMLARLGDAALPSLRQEVASDDVRRRRAGTIAFAGVQPLPEEDLQLLLSLAKDDDGDVRYYAVGGLTHLDPEREEITAALLSALDDPKLRFLAGGAFARRGVKGSPALGKLHEVLKTADASSRVHLANIIWQIDPDAPVVLETLTAALRDTKTMSGGYSAYWKMENGKRTEITSPMKRSVATNAAKYLGEMGPAAAPAIKGLMEAAQAEDGELQREAIETLGKIGPPAAEAIDLLTKIMAEGSWTGAAANEALCKIDPQGGWEKKQSPEYRQYPAVRTSQATRKARQGAAAGTSDGKDRAAGAGDGNSPGQ